MLGWEIARISGPSMEPLLPDGSFALFRAVRSVKRSDVLLVDHPEFGLIVKKVSAVSANGRVGLRGISRSSTSPRRRGNVDPERVLGRLALRMRWGRFLPRLSGARGKGYEAHDPGAMDEILIED